MRRGNRKTAPGVRSGKVQKKNRIELSRHYRNYVQDEVYIDRLAPGEAYRHVLLKRDVEKFITLLPDWKELSRDLDAIVLGPGSSRSMGWHEPGIVVVCAWDREIDGVWGVSWIDEHAPILDRLGVEREFLEDDKDWYHVHWTEASVKGFLLMHILLHELGHHHDRITTKSMDRAARGEDYAEAYALKYADRLWDDYFNAFGW